MAIITGWARKFHEIWAVLKSVLPLRFFLFAWIPIGAGSFLEASNFYFGRFLLLVLAVFCGQLALAALMAHRRLALGAYVRENDFFFPTLRWPLPEELLLPVAFGSLCLSVLFGLLLCLTAGWGLLVPGILAFLTLYLFACHKAYRRTGLGLALVVFVEGLFLGLAAFYAQMQYYSLFAFLGMLPIGLMLAAFVLSNEIKETDRDRAREDVSLATQWGKYFCYRLFYLCFVCAYIFILLNTLYGVTRFWPLLVFFTVPLAKPALGLAEVGKHGDVAAEQRWEQEMAAFYPRFGFAYVFTLLLAFAF